jgi:preprotein translocase subunit SecG
MGFILGLLTVIMVLDCVALVLLVLIQLPKKEAGAGLAFGGSASDALFGAGSGNVLTKITKYAATFFFVLAIVLSVMQSNYHGRTTSKFEQELSKKTGAGTGAPFAPKGNPTPPAETPNAGTPGMALTNTGLLSIPAPQGTNVSAPAVTAPATNPSPTK